MKKKLFRKILVISLVLTMLVFIVACGATNNESGVADSVDGEISAESSSEISTEVETKTVESITVAVPSDPGTLNPLAGMYNCVLNGMGETLFYNGVRGGCDPYLASHYEVVDPTTIRIYLYDDIYDTDGNHITASDVIFSWDKTIEIDGPQFFDYYDHATVIDDYCVELVNTSDDVNVYFNMITKVPILSEKAWEDHDMITDPCTTGPYMLESWVPGSSVTIVKNDNYWAADTDHRHPSTAQNVERVKYVFMSESSQVAIALENNEIDFAVQMNETEINRLSEMDGITVTSVPGTRSEGLMFSGVDSIFSDIRVRQAAAYAIDVDEVIAGACGVGRAEKTYTWSINDSTDFQERWRELDNYEYDLDKAIALMEEAGYDINNPVDITLLTYIDAINDATAVIIQSQLAKIGLNVTINSYERAAFNSALFEPSEYDLAVRPTGNDFIYTNMYWFDSRWDWKYGGMITGLTCDRFQEAIEKAMNSATTSEDSINEMVEVFNEECLGYMMFQWYEYFAHDAGITSVERDPSYGVHAYAFTFSDDFVPAT